MHLYESKIYTCITVVNKSIAWNSDPNCFGRRKKNGEMTKKKPDDDVNIKVKSAVVHANWSD